MGVCVCERVRERHLSIVNVLPTGDTGQFGEPEAWLPNVSEGFSTTTYSNAAYFNNIKPETYASVTQNIPCFQKIMFFMCLSQVQHILDRAFPQKAIP